MAREILLTRRNFVLDDLAQFSHGSWEIELTNLKDLNPQIVARAWNNHVKSTWFDLDLGRQRSVGLVHLQNVRAGSGATLRVQLATAKLDLYSAATAPGSAVLTFASTTGVVNGQTVENVFRPGTIPVGTVVLSHNATTVTMSNNVVSVDGAGVLSGNKIHFRTNTYDTGVVSAWPKDGEGLELNAWGEFSLDGLYSGEEYAALGMGRVLVPVAPVEVRYARVRIRNLTGLVPLEIGNFGLYETWEPPTPFNKSFFGWRQVLIDESEVRRVSGGATYINQRMIRRGMDFGFKFVPEAEFFLRSLGLGLVKGKSLPLVVLPFPDGEVGNLEKLMIYGLFSKEPEFVNSLFGHYDHVYRIESL